MGIGGTADLVTKLAKEAIARPVGIRDLDVLDVLEMQLALEQEHSLFLSDVFRKPGGVDPGVNFCVSARLAEVNHPIACLAPELGLE